VGSADTMWQGCLFSGGEFRAPARGGAIGVRDKASGEIFANAGLATDADVDAAAAMAKMAQQEWADQTYDKRAAVLRDAAAALGDRAKSFRELIMRETGSIGGRSGGDSNIEEFTQRRWLTVTPGPAHYPY
jgi:benzaldehyde dehydrogenase (NAD)